MKKRLLLISLALVMLMALMPATALADNARPVQTGDFTGSGQLIVTYMPEAVTKGPIWRFSGEVAVGFLSECDWDLLKGTSFYTVHNSIVNVDSGGNVNGVMKGTFIISRLDGTLEGTFSGRIRGNIYDMIIMDEGSWKSTGGTGVFEKVQAFGKWSADLNPGEVNGQLTLIGPLTWEGKYISRVR